MRVEERLREQNFGKWMAHSGIARIVQSYFHDMTNEEFAHFGIGNCQVLEYEWQNCARYR